jgi:transposase-like protein
VERELAVNRQQLRIASPSVPALPSSPTTEEVKSQTKQIRVRSRIVMQQMEVARQRRQQKLELFRMIKQMRAAGMKVSLIARQLGLCRRRIDKWIKLDQQMAGHESPRTTKLYDRTKDEITLSEVERIRL